MISIPNLVLPVWAKWVALGFLLAATWGHGYVTGMEHVYKKNQEQIVKTVYIQGKTTTKVVTKYIKEAKKIETKGEELKHEGQAYKIQFPNDDYIFNRYFVRVFNESLGAVSSLSSGDDAADSGVDVSTVLEASVHNNTQGLLWELRAKSCEEWAKEQEELGNK